MFQFKYFTIQQNRCGMKVGTDGVLLGAWTNTGKAKRILDVGTGTGLISLMLAQRTDADIFIDAIEIDEEACTQAQENVRNSQWSEKIDVVHSSLQMYEAGSNYDLIVSNPPYFMSSLKNPDVQRRTARHTDTLNPQELIAYSLELLHPSGQLALIYPPEEAIEFEKRAIASGLFLSRLTHVIPQYGAKEKRRLMQFSRNEKTETVKNELYIETNERHRYSKEYIELTKDFYLKF